MLIYNRSFFLLLFMATKLCGMRPQEEVKNNIKQIKINLGKWDNKTKQKFFLIKGAISDVFSADNKIAKIRPSFPLINLSTQELHLEQRNTGMWTFDFSIRHKINPFPRLSAIFIYQPEIAKFVGKLMLKKANQTEKEIFRQELNIPESKLAEVSAIQVDGIIDGDSLDHSKLNLTLLEKSKHVAPQLKPAGSSLKPKNKKWLKP